MGALLNQVAQYQRGLHTDCDVWDLPGYLHCELQHKGFGSSDLWDIV